MATVFPLKPLRVAPTSLANVVAPPYDVISPEERTALLARDPSNIVRLILPDGEGDAKYAEARRVLDGLVSSGAFTRDETPGFYRTEQTFTLPGSDGIKATRSGFLALVKLEPFSTGIILPHERTLSGPKEDRLKLFRATQTNLSPGFMLYRDPEQKLTAALATGREIARFTSQAMTESHPIENVLSKIDDAAAVATIQDFLAPLSLLIADGHHRYETALRYSQEIEAGLAVPSDAKAEHRYFMVFLTNEADPSLLVFPTHRLVHGLANMTLDVLLEKISNVFAVQTLEGGATEWSSALKNAGTTGPALVAVSKTGQAALLTLRPDFDTSKHPTLGSQPAALRQTDVAILHAVILEHALGIDQDAQAKQTNLKYLKDTSDAVKRIQAGEGDLLFLMNATPVAQVRAVAEAGEVMPQKSTYFFPKVLTGLAIHTLDPSRLVG